ncbi:single-stranded-DNA-specific exonuclease RecJ [Campylobacter geochelonis]|uniref:Single-stranded-DNA-specific exonuclease RecJ n=1 Tax=Campylobacter geochelonis TaxID=1780362 RepID=A0A128EBE5_9BACT|nr:single-stranded-DNA-specific exonuclease RecJ [Campylobacter geochelonis]CZE46290.1 single-stranded-DNA-specific exonuclease RecJ [Campylobacter geochelonis]CZE46341.1 single-stranded-DNA-specific exonuclease RecJ [Campylobacter geochelonis]
MLGKKEVRELLEKRFSKDIHTKISEIPLPCHLKDTYKAAMRIKTAINENERIAVVGDYDVDGVVSSVIMADFLELMGADFFVKIPNRFTDGYGLNASILDEFDGVDLIVTVDNGISAVDAAKICKEKKIDLIITDHHMPPPVLPDAYAIINPKQKECPFPNIEICGAEVAWYLVGALKDVCKIEYDMSLALDLLVIAIIADMMELRDMNRVLVRMGIKKLNLSKRPCFRAIKEFNAKDKFEFDDISFLIAPLINCTGRMDDASLSYKFLRSKNIKEANYYLETIVKLNTSRKEEEKNLYENSLLEISGDDEIIVTWGDDWHEGVIGIVASRLCKQYRKPAIVFSVDKDRAKGSARSVGKFDILRLIASQKDMLLSFGGHKGAAGLTIEPSNLEAFKKAINASCFLQDLNTPAYADELLGELDVGELDLEMLEILEFFEPYGQKNPKPVFCIQNALVRNVRYIGKDQIHIKISFEKDGAMVEGLFFNYDYMPCIGDSVNLIVSVIKNNFRGVVTPELLIKEIS